MAGDRKMGHNELEGLSSFHLDVIRETVNIGAGNAATALSQLVGSAVTMDVPKAELVSIY
ncbi:MAG: chemotaxis protein CheC, partial [Acetomicrobium sp.]